MITIPLIVLLYMTVTYIMHRKSYTFTTWQFWVAMAACGFVRLLIVKKWR